MPEFVVGVDLGGTFIKAALVDPDRGAVRFASKDTGAHKGPQHVVRQIVSIINELDEGRNACKGVGIGAPGTVNWERTRISAPPNFPGWDVVDLSGEVRAMLGYDIPVVVENDASVAALGSAHFGTGRPYDHFIMVTLGTGVGGAIIHNKSIFRGATGGAGELGHMTIDYEGPLARSGVAGAVEGYLGQRYLSQHARYWLLSRKESLVHKMAGRDLAKLTPRILYEAAAQGDEAAREVFNWAGHKLGCVLGSAINLLDIRTVIVGGGLSAAGDFILDSARATVVRFVTPALREGIQILREEQGNKVATLGAARLVQNHIA